MIDTSTLFLKTSPGAGLSSVRAALRTPAASGSRLRLFGLGFSFVAAALLLGGTPSAARAGDDDIIFTFWGDYHLNASSSFELESGIAQLAGDFDVAINDSSRFDLANATLQIVGFPNGGPYEIEAMAEDIGFCDLSLPDPGLFSMKRLWIGPSTIQVRFVDNHDNAVGVENEAIYVETLRFESGTSLDVRGLNLYYINVIPANAGQPGSGVTITDSVGGGGIWALGTDSPVTPVNPGTSDNEICVGDSTTLFVDDNPPLEVDWYTDDCGISPSNRPLGTFVGTGNPLTVFPTATTIYWAQSRNPTTGCISRICSDPVEVIVHDNPLCTVTTDAVTCTDQEDLVASVENAGSNTIYDWVVTGGDITSGQNTDTITYSVHDVPSITLEVTVSKTWAEGDGSTCVTTCQTIVQTQKYEWIGTDGESFTMAANWNPATVPGSIQPGGDALVFNNTASDNRCVFDAPVVQEVCNLKVAATGSGRQILQIDAGATMTTTVASWITTGGEIALRGGELAGGPVYNSSNTVEGYGRITADLVNTGLVQTTPLDILRITNASTANQSGGLIRAVLGSGMIIHSGTIDQTGEIEVQSNATVVIQSPLTNGAGGLLRLYNGTLGCNGLTNDAGGNIYGFGTIQSNLVNDGDLTTIADAAIIGDVQNEGVITIQNGLLTITGTLSGAGTIIGGFGGRDGPGSSDTAGLVIRGDFLPAAIDSNQLDLSNAMLWMNGDTTGRQRLEVLAVDQGAAVALPAPELFSIDTLRIGPSATTVQLVNTRLNGAHAARGRGATEALYVRHLQLDPGATLDLAGLTLYYEHLSPSEGRGPATAYSVVDSVGGGALRRLTGPAASHPKTRR